MPEDSSDALVAYEICFAVDDFAHTADVKSARGHQDHPE
jgi:hypothetical protein